MAKNIYELFNERKNGMDYLVEGYDVDLESVEGYEDIDTAVEELNNLTESYNNEYMEFQAACYLEELIIESMMYDDFNEEKIGAVIEGSMKEKASGVVEKLKALWNKLKTWVQNAYKTVTNLFQSGEALIKQHGPANVQTAIKNCNKKVKMPEYNDHQQALSSVTNLMSKSIKVEGMSKNEVLSAFEIKKVKDLDEKVHKMFVKGDKKEVTINQLPAAQIVDAVERKKAVLDALTIYSKKLDVEFKEIIGIASRAGKSAEGGEADEINNTIEAFNLGQAIKNRLVGRAMKEYQSMFKNYVSVVRASINPMRSAKEAKKAEKEAEKEEVKESFVYDEIEFL